MNEMKKIEMVDEIGILTCIPTCEKGIYLPFRINSYNGGRYCE